MSQHSNKSLDFFIGALVGGVLGGAASLLTAPKSGRKLRHDLSDVYEDISDKAQEFTQHIKHNGNGQIEHDVNYLLLGGIAGATIGAVSALLSAPKSGRELREDLICTTQKWAKNLNQAGRTAAKTAGERTGDFREVVKDIADKFLEKTDRKYGSTFQHKLDDIVDFANIGIRLFRGSK